jgi:hypothetical protein
LASSQRRTLLKLVGYCLGGFILARASSEPRVFAQTTEIDVGPAAVIPVVDGVWSVSEWENDTSQESLAHSYFGKGQCVADLRLKHTYTGNNSPDARLYGLLDVITDNGSKWFDQSFGTYRYGEVTMSIDSGNDGDMNGSDDYVVYLHTSDGQTVVIDGLGQHVNDVTTSSIAATKIGTSPNSSTNHRIWEFSLPLAPILKYARNQNGLTTIGFNVYATDSNGNGSALYDRLGPITITLLPVPEGIEPLIPVGIAALLLRAYSKRRNSISKAQ